MEYRISTHAEAIPELDSNSCYRALMAKDTRFDGVFFTGVKTTGIYCRPICVAKTPRESSCVFFSTAAAAEAAGFRPCLRCRPELAPYALQQNLAYAVWQRIAAGALNDREDKQAVERLADEVGLSSRQLRRVLYQHFGVTPIELAQTQRLLFAKKLLQETRLPMADVAYAAGFGSVRRFNALFVTRYGMAPTALRRAVEPEQGEPEELTLRLAYRPPFAWREIIAYLAGRTIPGVESIECAGAGCYMRSVRIGNTAGWLRVTHLATKRQLELRIAPGLAPALMPLLARVRGQFDLDANPAVIEAHLMQDSLLASKIAATPGLRVPSAFDAFELAVCAVLGQQVSVAGAATLSGRLATRFGIAADTPFVNVMRHFPDAEKLARIPVAAMAQIGLPKMRAQTICNLAQFAALHDLLPAPGASLDATVARLKSIKGIGDWTAHYIALRALRYPDAFPAGDLGLKKAIAEEVSTTAPTVRLTEKQLIVRAAAWSPWRSYAALLLWHPQR